MQYKGFSSKTLEHNYTVKLCLFLLISGTQSLSEIQNSPQLGYTSSYVQAAINSLV